MRKKTNNQKEKKSTSIQEDSEINRLRKELEETKNQFNSLFELTNDAIILADLDGRYIKANKRAADLLGFNKENLDNLSANDFVHPDDQLDLSSKLEEIKQGTVLPFYERKLINKNGKLIIAEINLSLMRDSAGDGIYIQSVMRDITRRKEIENLLVKERKIFHKIAIESLKSNNIRKFSNEILTLLCEDLDFDLGSLRIFNEKKQSLNLLSYYGPSSQKEKLVEEMPIHDNQYIISKVLNTRIPIFAPDVTKIEGIKTIAKRISSFGVKSMISWPILNENKQLIGTIQLISSTPKTIPTKDRAFFESIANVLAVALEKQIADEKLSEAYSEKEQLFEAISMSPLVFFIWKNEKGHPVEFVSENVDIWDYSPEDFLSGKINYGSIIHPDDRRDEGSVENHYLHTTEPYEFPFEYRIKTKDGSYRWVIEYSIAKKNVDGEITHYSGFIFDITNRKVTEEALASREQLLEQIFEHTGSATILINEDMTIAKCNQQFELLSGRVKDDVEGKIKWTELLPLPSKEKMLKFHEQRRNAETAVPLEYEFEFIDQNNEQRFAFVTVGVLPDTNQSVASVIDLTDRKKAEQMVLSERMIFKSIAEATLEKSNLKDLCETILKGFVSTTGLNFGAIRTYNPEDNALDSFVRVDKLEKLRSTRGQIPLSDENHIIAQVARERKPFFFTEGYKSKLSPKFSNKIEELGICTLLTYPLIDSKNQLLGAIQLASYFEDKFIQLDKSFYDTMVGFLSSAMEKLSTQKELAESENRYRTTVETMSDGITIIEDGNVIFANDRIVDLLELSKESLQKKLNLDTLFRNENDEIYSTVASLAEKGLEHGTSEFWVTLDNNQKRFFSHQIALEYEGKIPSKIFVLTHDKTKEKIAEESLKKLNEELENRVSERTMQLNQLNRELESFSYSISHDLRTPLRSIDGFSQALQEDYSDYVDEIGQDYLRRIRGATTRMSSLIDDILSLSRLTNKKLNRVEINLSELVKEILNDFKMNDPERDVELDIMDNVTIFADKTLLRTVMENLIGNAWKFTSKSKHPKITFGFNLENKGIIYYIQDNGVGFNESYIDKLFTVFQRLHSINEFPGTGIGLAVVHKIITKHKGKIWAKSKLGKGATFFFTFESSKNEDGEIEE